MNKVIGIILAVLFLGGGLIWYLVPASLVPETEDEVVCAADARICEDGSYVGRVAPICEFAACPGIKEESKTSVGIQETWEHGRVKITPLEILEDSRCPEDVVCIQAGTVRLKASVTIDGVTEQKELQLGAGQTVGAYQVTLLGVLPRTFQTVFIQAEEYRFEFAVMPTTPG
jgi:hypothetical protein